MTIEEIKKSIDLADHVRSCGIELKKHGKKRSCRSLSISPGDQTILHRQSDQKLVQLFRMWKRRKCD